MMKGGLVSLFILTTEEKLLFCETDLYERQPLAFIFQFQFYSTYSVLYIWSYFSKNPVAQNFLYVYLLSQ